MGELWFSQKSIKIGMSAKCWIFFSYFFLDIPYKYLILIVTDCNSCGIFICGTFWCKCGECVVNTWAHAAPQSDSLFTQMTDVGHLTNMNASYCHGKNYDLYCKPGRKQAYWNNVITSYSNLWSICIQKMLISLKP